MDINQLQSSIEPHLERIEALLPDRYKLTLVLRNTERENAAADIVLSIDDDLQKVINSITELMPNSPGGQRYEQNI